MTLRITNGYNNNIPMVYEQQYRQRTLHYLEKKAQSLGFELVPHSSPEGVS